MTSLLTGIQAARRLFGGKTLVLIGRQDDLTEFLQLEATLEETHSESASTTDHPVEDGADITDHIRRNPTELSLKGIVSNYPILVLASIRAQPSIPGGDPSTRAEDAYRWLVEAKDQGKLLSVGTTLRDYSNMAILGITVVRDKDRSNVVELDLSLREIIVATTEQVAPPAPTNTARSAAANAGRKSTGAASAATTTKSQSILSSLFSAFGG